MRLFAGTPFDRPPTCDRCGQLEADCDCVPIPEPIVYLPPEQQTAHLSRQKRKRGKVVTCIDGLKSDETDLAELLTRLKNECGAGGTMQGETLEIQGDQLPRIERVLKQIGYRVRNR